MNVVRENIIVNQWTVTIEIPNHCPHCHSINTPKIMGQSSYHSERDFNFGLLVKCSNCGEFFALSYVQDPATYPGIKFDLINYSYSPNVEFDLPAELEEVSPLFKTIYLESKTAEQLGLNQIAGVGFRKAIEFLVKDYAIYLHPEKEENIKSKFLGNVINDDISDTKIQSLAKASTWIGNDETHYTRDWENKTVADMKSFLFALVSFISYDLIYLDSLEMIEEKSSKGSK